MPQELFGWEKAGFSEARNGRCTPLKGRSLLCHCEAGEVSRSNLVRGMRLPRTFQVLAMTKGVVLDESSNYKHVEGLMNQTTTKMPKIEREIQIKQPPMVKEVK